MTSTHRRTVVAAIVIGGLTIAGCGDSNGDAPGAAPATSSPSSAQGTVSAEPAVTTTPVTTGAPEMTTALTTGAPATTLSIGVTGGWESRVEPLLGPGPDGTPLAEIDVGWRSANEVKDVEQRIVRAVADGELDLGFVGTRAFGELGLTAFDVLTAPLLIDGYTLQQAVLDSSMPDEMMAALSELGVTGLAVAAGPLRRPMGVDGAMTRADDFAGTTFHTWHAATNAATVAALGATYTDVFGDERNEGLIDGSIDGTENGLDWALGNPYAPYVTLDVVLWPATGVLIANPNVLEALGDGDRQRLADAAAGMASAAEYADADAQLIGELCATVVRFTDASDADIDSLRRAVEPVLAELAADPTAAAHLTEIKTLAQTHTDEPWVVPDGCDGEVPAPATTVAASAESVEDPSVLNGSYRFEWTEDELNAALAAVDVTDPVLAAENAGVITLTFADGRFELVSSGMVDDRCAGTYTVADGRLTLVASDRAAEWGCGSDTLGRQFNDSAFEVSADQLVLSDFELSPEPDVTWWNALFFSKPMMRVE